MNFTKILFFMKFLFVAGALSAQSSSGLPAVPKLEDIIQIPKSPEAFAFAKYGNTSISHFSGVPNISIPIGQLKGRDITLPIELTYDASGIRVDQIASEVGLGWNLKIGGMIVRNVKGLPDDYTAATPSYFPYYSTSNFPGSTPVVTQYNHFINNNLGNNNLVNRIQTGSNWAEEWPVRFLKFTEQVEKGNIDSQPDTYTLSVNGLSGTIVIDYATSTGYCIDNPEIMVVPNLINSSNGVKQIDSWQITDGSGNVYQFGNNSAKEVTQYYENNSAEVSRTFTSGWKLTTITTGKLKETVTFTYGLESWTNDQPIVSYYSLDGFSTNNCASISNAPNLNPYYKITSRVLQSVTFSSASSNQLIITRVSREDLPGQTAISQLRFNNEYGTALSYVKFNRSYFSSGSSHLQKRLKLESLAFHGDNASSTNPQVYMFTYNSTELPSRDSNGRDYFGYYNGINSNSTLLAFNSTLNNGANREVNSGFHQAGILTSIKYPTKGFTNFYYQANKEYSYSSSAIWQNAYSNTWTSGTPEAYCDDIVGTTLNVQYQSFTAPVTGSYKVNFTKNVDASSQVQLIALYKGSKSLCDLVWESGSDIMYKQYSQAINQEVYITLEANQVYNVAMANNTNQNASMQLTVSYLSNVSLAEYKSSAGLRIQRIEDYSALGIISSKKHYYYNDGSGLNGPAIIDLVNSGNYISSGIKQTSALLERNQYRQGFDSQYQYVDCSYIERSGTTMMQGNGMNFSYSKVSELSTNEAGEYHLKTFEFQNESEVKDGPFVTSSPLLGKMTKEATYSYESTTGSFNIVEENLNTYDNIELTQPYSIRGLHFFGRDNIYHNLILVASPSDPSKIAWGYSQMLIAGFIGPPQPQGCNSDPAGSHLYCIQNGALPYKFHYKFGGYRRQFPQLVGTINKKYSRANALMITQTYTYNSTTNYQISQVSMTSSEGNVIQDTFTFPLPTNNSALFNQNRLKELLNSKKVVNGNDRAESNVIFSTFNTNQILTQRIEERMNAGVFSNIITINSYDNLGNIREAVKRDGVVSTMIWGHLGRKLVLEVKGGTYAQVLAALGGTLILGDNNRNLSAAQVNTLRANLPQSFVSHYVYGSHHGVTRITDENGRNSNYTYDGFGRLLEVRDHDNYILERYSYNFKN
jgi:YD repeat-containing protein